MAKRGMIYRAQLLVVYAPVQLLNTDPSLQIQAPVPESQLQTTLCVLIRCGATACSPPVLAKLASL